MEPSLRANKVWNIQVRRSLIVLVLLESLIHDINGVEINWCFNASLSSHTDSEVYCYFFVAQRTEK